MKKIVLIMLSLFILCSCNSKVEEQKDYQTIMQEKAYEIIDVRTSSEYNESHIKGAINIPYDEITEESNISKEKAIFVYCRSGTRSKIAYDKLKELGYEVYDLGSIDNIDLPKEQDD